MHQTHLIIKILLSAFLTFTQKYFFKYIWPCFYLKWLNIVNLVNYNDFDYLHFDFDIYAGWPIGFFSLTSYSICRGDKKIANSEITFQSVFWLKRHRHDLSSKFSNYLSIFKMVNMRIFFMYR